MLIDTCILIDHFRGDSRVTQYLLDNAGIMKISAVTDMEMSQGLRNKQELAAYEKLLQTLSIPIVDISEEISVKARLWTRSYGLSHQLHLADALIAATAALNNEVLVTANTRDFRFLQITLESVI